MAHPTDGPLRATANARVTLTVEVTVRDNWGTNATIDHIYKLAAEEARAVVRGGYEGAEKMGRPVRIIGEPKVTTIIVEQER